MNNNACYNFNTWLIKNRNDPGQQLSWLENELSQLESKGGFAIIIAHIPIYACLSEYGRRYTALMERYQHIVRFSNFGHTHQNDLYLTSSQENSQPIGLNVVTGSVTTYINRNPSFSVIDWDSEYMVPINIHVYYFNISKAN